MQILVDSFGPASIYNFGLDNIYFNIVTIHINITIIEGSEKKQN